MILIGNKRWIGKVVLLWPPINKPFPIKKVTLPTIPPARWVFQFFTGIHLLVIQSVHEVILNLKEAHQILLALLGAHFIALYANSE